MRGRGCLAMDQEPRAPWLRSPPMGMLQRPTIASTRRRLRTDARGSACSRAVGGGRILSRPPDTCPDTRPAPIGTVSLPSGPSRGLAREDRRKKKARRSGTSGHPRTVRAEPWRPCTFSLARSLWRPPWALNNRLQDPWRKLLGEAHKSTCTCASICHRLGLPIEGVPLSGPFPSRRQH